MSTESKQQMTATNVKEFRHSLGLTQAELASRLGVSQESVSQWEHGKKRPSKPVLMLFLRLKEELRNAAKK